jgi:hypothetical protein
MVRNSFCIVQIYCMYKGKCLKVPKCKSFDRSDFPDFYTIKPFCCATLGLTYKFVQNTIFRCSFRAAKFLTRMLSLILRTVPNVEQTLEDY